MPKLSCSCWAHQVVTLSYQCLALKAVLPKKHNADPLNCTAGNLFIAMDMADRDNLIEYVFPDGRLPLLTQVQAGLHQLHALFAILTVLGSYVPHAHGNLISYSALNPHCTES